MRKIFDGLGRSERLALCGSSPCVGGLTLIKKYGVPEGGLENKDKGQTGTQNRTKQGHERGQGHAPGPYMCNTYSTYLEGGSDT